jgi:hypothetical protein
VITREIWPSIECERVELMVRCAVMANLTRRSDLLRVFLRAFTSFIGCVFSLVYGLQVLSFIHKLKLTI